MAVFNPDELVRLAARIEEQAVELRARARCLSSAAHQARWHSPAATVFRDQVLRLDRRVQQAAHNLDRAAHELRVHAGHVRAAQAAVAAAVQLEQAAANGAECVVVGAADAIEHAIGRAGHWVGVHL